MYQLRYMAFTLICVLEIYVIILFPQITCFYLNENFIYNGYF